MSIAFYGNLKFLFYIAIWVSFPCRKVKKGDRGYVQNVVKMNKLYRDFLLKAPKKSHVAKDFDILRNEREKGLKKKLGYTIIILKKNYLNINNLIRSTVISNYVK